MAACLVFGQLTAWPGAWSIQPRRRINVDVVIKYLKKISHLLKGAGGVTPHHPVTMVIRVLMFNDDVYISPPLIFSSCGLEAEWSKDGHILGI
jgi:hypothetical protein